MILGEDGKPAPREVHAPRGGGPDWTAGLRHVTPRMPFLDLLAKSAGHERARKVRAIAASLSRNVAPPPDPFAY